MTPNPKPPLHLTRREKLYLELTDDEADALAWCRRHIPGLNSRLSRTESRAVAKLLRGELSALSRAGKSIPANLAKWIAGEN